ncbi:hypothetical protein [Loktanella sp. M215]|uniref:hypothetical protein n=1 Tax=Loktanella sp. M215 TaxID=2675431 RepID=UPI001F2660BB|nr:hypothetical protein [Loktanella sp. M215]MCF7699053.1 hypothetical protein [Loktanella sp. M215]
MAFFAAVFLTSVFTPGTVAVVLGGALAAQGLYHIGDMIWFVAIGTILGAEASYRIGRHADIAGVQPVGVVLCRQAHHPGGVAKAGHRVAAKRRVEVGHIAVLVY